MIRRLIWLGLFLVALLVIGVLAAGYFVGSTLANGVERAGSAVTKVDVDVARASLGVLSGSGRLSGVVIANPEGFQSPAAIKAESIAVSINPRSLLSDKVVVHSVNMRAPEVTLEGGLQGNNLSKLLENIRATMGTGSSDRKLQVDDLLITGGQVHLRLNLSVLGSKSTTVPLPEIHLTGLGQGPQGITAAEFSEKLLSAILQSATKSIAGDLGSLGKVGGAGGASTGAVQQLEKAVKGIGDLLKKK